MLMKDNKKGMALIIAKKLGSPEQAPMSDDGAEMDSSIGHKSAAEEILKAVESKDASALVDALKSFVEMCQNDYEPEESEESES